MADQLVTKPEAPNEEEAEGKPMLVDTSGRPLRDGDGQGSGNGTDETELAPSKTIRTSRRMLVIMAIAAILGLLLILWAWRLPPFANTVVTTENSYVRGQITVLAPQVNGYVAEVMIRDYDQVKAGQPLMRIDDRIYRQQLEQAQGQLCGGAR